MTPLPSLRILDAELLKVRRRWIPYVLLAALIFLLGVQIFLAGYLNWRMEDDPTFRDAGLVTFALPWAIPPFLSTIQFWGGILLGVLAASVVATEYGWGTVRQALIRGQGRTHYLTAKLLALAILGAAGFVTAVIVAFVFSVIATRLAGQPITLEIAGGDGPSIGDIALMCGRAGYAMLPYGLLGFSLAVVGRSTTVGVTGVLLYAFVEAIVLAVLGGIGGATADARGFFPGHNVLAILAENRVGFVPGSISLSPREFPPPPASELPDPTVAALVLALYCAVFLAIAYTDFLRRDLHA